MVVFETKRKISSKDKFRIENCKNKKDAHKIYCEIIVGQRLKNMKINVNINL